MEGGECTLSEKLHVRSYINTALAKEIQHSLGENAPLLQRCHHSKR